MIQRIKSFFRYHFEQPNYLYFFLSLILMLIVPALVPVVYFGELLLEITFGLVILMACIYCSRSYKDLVFLAVLGTLVYVFFGLYTEFYFLSIFSPLTTLIFFGVVFTRLMQFIFKPKAITFNDILALCSGYLVLGVIAAPFFYVIDMRFVNAYSIPKGSEFYEFLYFSYITLTSVGYGDIVPQHRIAKSVAVIVGIIGQLYLAILVGIIVGKYLTGRRDSETNE